MLIENVSVKRRFDKLIRLNARDKSLLFGRVGPYHRICRSIPLFLTSDKRLTSSAYTVISQRYLK